MTDSYSITTTTRGNDAAAVPAIRLGSLGLWLEGQDFLTAAGKLHALDHMYAARDLGQAREAYNLLRRFEYYTPAAAEFVAPYIDLWAESLTDARKDYDRFHMNWYAPEFLKWVDEFSANGEAIGTINAREVIQAYYEARGYTAADAAAEAKTWRVPHFE